MDKKIILFELNEVPFRIIEQFCAWRPESCIARLLPRMRKLETFAEDVSPLSPWITWPTVHRGVTDEKHRILNFGQDLSEVDAQYPPLWQILSAHGIKVGVCGSLHSFPMPEDVEKYSFFIPDTFAAGSECFPKYVSLFQDFNLKMARASARNVSRKIPWSTALRVLAAAPGLGLKLETFMDLGFQLLSERVKQSMKVRRRTYQSVLAFDVFMKQLETSKPDFATFFTNHVASSMHRYWAATFPEDYGTFGYDQAWVKAYCHEIDWTMHKADQFLTRLVHFTRRNPDYQIWITTSMGQAATEAEPVSTQLFITNMPLFIVTMGL
jgi:hypothetical protein